jgi:hypothetical protein
MPWFATTIMPRFMTALMPWLLTLMTRFMMAILPRLSMLFHCRFYRFFALPIGRSASIGAAIIRVRCAVAGCEVIRPAVIGCAVIGSTIIVYSVAATPSPAAASTPTARAFALGFLLSASGRPGWLCSIYF